MVLLLKKGASKKEIEAIEKKLYKEKPLPGFNAKKYNGILSLTEDPLSIQLKLRDEWERDLSWYQYHFNLLSGSDTLENVLQGKDIYLSFITELELIGYKNISIKEEQQIQRLLNDCSILQITNPIKQNYIELRKKYTLKLADAIIAATALALNLPLITSDKQFKIIKGLNLISYQHNIDLT